MVDNGGSTSGSSVSSKRTYTTLDNLLDRIISTLKVLEDASGLIPVAAVGVAIPIVRKIVEQLRKARTNKDIALGLAEDIFKLIDAINDTVKCVQIEIGLLEHIVGNNLKSTYRPEQFNNPGQFNAMVDELKDVLNHLHGQLDMAQRGNFFVRALQNSKIEAHLAEAKRGLEGAIKLFENKQLIVVTLNLKHVQARTVEIRSRVEEIHSIIESSAYDEALERLPHVKKAHYHSIGESGFLEGTRVDLINDLFDFTKKPKARGNNVYLITGPAGIGKSTVAREICRLLDDENILAGSFFFVRSDAGDLGTTGLVFPTLAHQLAALHPPFRPYIAEAAREYTRLQSGSQKAQLQSLIIDPVKKAQECGQISPEYPLVIVLDALDEAGRDLIDFLGLVKELADEETLFRIILTTRPEPSILHALSEVGIETRESQTDMEKIPHDTVDADIRRFLSASFQRLRWRYLLLREHPDAIAKLAEIAERLFIFARAVMEYLNHWIDEISLGRLTGIIRGNTGKMGMSALAQLYSTVLQKTYDQETMGYKNVRARVIAVLAGLVVLQDQVTIKILAPLMGVEEEAAAKTVEELRSIISCNGHDVRKDTIRPLHLTFREFLLDEEHCAKGFYIDQRTQHLWVAKSCLRIMNAELRQDMCQLGDMSKDETDGLEILVQERIPPHVRYACLYWTAHLVKNEPKFDDDIQLLLEQFSTTKVLQWIEVLSFMNRLDSAIHALLKAYPWAKEFMGVATLFEDAYRFVAKFYELIDETPGQIYISALLFAPKCSLVNVYDNEERIRIMVSSQERHWGTCLNIVNNQWGEALYSRDGQLILSRSENEIVIRDATTANPRKTLQREIAVISVDSHPNSRTVVFLMEDGRLEEWEWSTDLQSTRTHALPEAERYDSNDSTPWYGQVTYSGDGSRIVCHCGSVDEIFVSSVGDRTQLVVRIPIATEMVCETFSLDAEGVYLVALLTFEGEQAIVKRWNIETGEEMCSFQVEMDEVYEAVFAKDNKMLVTGHEEKICVWNLEDDCWTLSLIINSEWTALDVTQSGDVIAYALFDINFMNARSGDLLGEYRGHSDRIRSLRFSPQEDRLVSTSDDGTLRIWDTSQEALSFSSDHNLDLDNVKFFPNGKRIVATEEEEVRVFDSKDGSFIHKFIGHTRPIISVAFSADGSLLATYSEHDGVFLWDVERNVTHPWTLVRSKRLGDGPMLTFNANVTLLAVVSPLVDSFIIRIWDIEDRPDETETGVGNIILQINRIDGPTPHCIRFTHAEPLSLLRHLERDEVEVIIWNHTRDAVETCAYDENIHATLKPAFDEEEGWIVSMRTGRHLLWLPENRRSIVKSQFAESKGMIAVASGASKFTVLDMSRLSDM